MQHIDFCLAQERKNQMDTSILTIYDALIWLLLADRNARKQK